MTYQKKTLYDVMGFMYKSGYTIIKYVIALLKGLKGKWYVKISNYRINANSHEDFTCIKYYW